MKNKFSYILAIKGYYGFTNFGDDALMQAAYDIARRIIDPARIAVVCNNAHYVSRFVPGARIVSNEHEREISPAIELYGGGTQFFSFSPLSPVKRTQTGRVLTTLRHSIRAPHAVLHRLKYIVSRYTGFHRRVAAIGIGIGPFISGDVGEEKTKSLFRQMEFISVRDLESYQLCQKWGVKNLHKHADLCYLSSLPNFGLHHNTRSRIGRIGVIVRDWQHTVEGDSYCEALFGAVQRLRNSGKNADFILFTHGYDPIWRQRLTERKEVFVEWNPEADTIEGFLSKLSNYDAFITTRFHGAVFASILGRPVVCLGIEPKLRLVSELLADGACLWDFPFSTDTCVDAIHSLDTTYKHAVDCLYEVCRNQRALAAMCAEEFVGFVSTLGASFRARCWLGS